MNTKIENRKQRGFSVFIPPCLSCRTGSFEFYATGAFKIAAAAIFALGTPFLASIRSLVKPSVEKFYAFF